MIDLIAPKEKVGLDEKHRGLPDTISNKDEYRAFSLPNKDPSRPLEPELKFNIPNSYKVFKIYAEIYEKIKSPQSPIILADDKIIARDPLVSFALDTAEYDIMRTTGEQLRLRGPLDLSKIGHADPTEILWRGQATVKTLFSEAAGIGADRMELEALTPSKDIRFAYGHFIDIDKPNLHPIYNDLTIDDLYVSCITITTRASFNSVVYVPEYDAYVEFEQTCDPNFFLTPNGDVRASKDLELEAEAKQIYARAEMGFTDEQLIDIYETAKAKYRSYILSEYPDFEEAKYSKVERSLISVSDFYTEQNRGDIEFNSLASTDRFIAELPYSNKIKAGMVHSIRQGVTIFDAMEKIDQIAGLALTMAQPSQLIPANQNGGHACAADKRDAIKLRI